MNLPLIDNSLKPNPPYQFRYRVNSVDFPEFSSGCFDSPDQTYFTPNGIDIFLLNPNTNYTLTSNFSSPIFDPCDPPGGDFLVDMVSYTGQFCGELGFALSPGGYAVLQRSWMFYKYIVRQMCTEELQNNWLGHFIYGAARQLLHEIGHANCLSHTVLCGTGTRCGDPGCDFDCNTISCDDQCSDTPCWEDMLIQNGVHPGDCSQDPNSDPALFSNNLMDYCHSTTALTVQQLGRFYHQMINTKFDDIYPDYCSVDHQWDVIIPGTETLVWSANRIFKGDIILEAGANLTLTGHLYMPEDARIIVKQGARFTVDGGCISNRCGLLWTGIEVWGNNNLSQTPESNQGVVELKNGAIIENANVGVWVRKNDVDCNLVLGSGGGIVKVSNSLFKNNYVDVEFAPYTWINTQGSPISNKSYFKNSEFITTRRLNENFFPKTHLILNENYRIRINGCRFENEAIADPNDVDYTDYHNRGNGIVAHSSTFLVDDYCSAIIQLGQSCPPESTIHSTFTNLYHGVYESCGDFRSTFSVKNAIFSDNFCGIRAEGMAVGPSILSNTFYVNSIDDNVDAEEPLGIDIDNTTKFEIEENHFMGGTYNADPPLIGIAFTNTAFNCGGQNFKPSTQTLYRNWFDNLRRGIHVQGDNDGINPFSQDQYGLEFRCNKFGQTGPVNNADIFLNSNTTVQEVQGYYIQNTEAGNLFSDNYSLNEMGHWDIGSGSTIIDKYYHNLDNNIPSVPFLAPFGYDGQELIPFGTSNGYLEANTCPVLISTGQTHSSNIQKFAIAKATYEDTYNIYIDNVDKGNTQGLIAFLQNPSRSSIEIRNELISCSPYVSEQAWRTVFQRNPALNPWHLAQALLYNSPLKQSVVQMMYTYNFDEYYRELVANGQSGGVTDKTLLEADLSRFTSQMQTAEGDFIRGYLLFEEDDEINRIAPINSHFSNSSSGTDKYIRASILMQQGNYTAASSILGSCMQNGELDGYCRVLSILNSANMAPTCPRFTQAQMSELESIASDESNPGCTQARALLFEEDGVAFPINIWDDAPEFRKIEDHRTTEKSHLMRVSPNPANDIAVISFKFELGAEKIELFIYDNNGRKVVAKDLSSSKGIFEWNCKGLSSGPYIVQLKFDDIVVDTITTIVQN